MTYPYLGVKEFNTDEHVVIFFTEKNKGVVVDNTTISNDSYKFGRYGEYDEDDFDFLREGVCVRLNN